MSISESLRCRVAELLAGRLCVYKEKGYVGPVLVERAKCEAGALEMDVTTRPWDSAQEGQAFVLMGPLDGVAANGFSIAVGAYGAGGTLVHAQRAIDEIEALRRSGASRQQLVDAINAGEGLSDAVRALLRQPFGVAEQSIPGT